MFEMREIVWSDLKESLDILNWPSGRDVDGLEDSTISVI